MTTPFTNQPVDPTPVGAVDLNKPPPSPPEVNKFHQYDDLDRDDQAHHHTLGSSGNQAAPGNHKGHMTGSVTTVTGSRGGNVALASLLSALAARGIITDGTVA